MKSIKLLWIAMFAILLGIGNFNVFAAYDGEDQTAIVPMEVFAKGRAHVTRFLLRPVDRLCLKIKGQSVVTTNDRDSIWIYRWELEELGYKFDGSFSDLSRIIATRRFKAMVMPLDDGSFDVQVNVKLLDKDGLVLLLGSGYVSINYDDGVMVSTCEPYLSIPERIRMSVPGQASSGKWIAGNRSEQSQDFWGYVERDNGTSVFQNVPTAIIGRGYFAFQPWDGPLQLIDLGTGLYLTGNKILVIMGESRSPDVRVVKDVKKGWPSFLFYKIGDKYYGRYPLLDVPAGTTYEGSVDFSVPVWGMEISVIPQSVTVIGLTDGVETVVQPNEKGYWPINIKPNQGYHIIVDFGGWVQDWPEGMG